MLRDLPVTNYEIFGTDNDDRRIPMETIDLWSLHKNSIVNLARGAVDKELSATTGDAQTFSSASRSLLSGITGSKTASVKAREDMEKLLAEFSQQVCLPIVEEKAQEKAIKKLMMPESPQS